MEPFENINMIVLTESALQHFLAKV